MSLDALVNPAPETAVPDLATVVRDALSVQARLRPLHVHYCAVGSRQPAVESLRLGPHATVRPCVEAEAEAALRDWVEALAELGLYVATLGAGGDDLATAASGAWLGDGDIAALRVDVRRAFRAAAVSIPPDGLELVVWASHGDGQRRCGTAAVTNAPLPATLQEDLRRRFARSLDRHAAWFRPVRRLGAGLLIPAND